MGTWGAGLYANDQALDIKDTYMEYLRGGKLPAEAVKLLAEEYQPERDDEDGWLFWPVIADAQWNYGHMGEDVLNKALASIKAAPLLPKWRGVDEKFLREQWHQLALLEERLRSPMPPPKKVRVYRGKKCPWKVGDIISFKLTRIEEFASWDKECDPFWDRYTAAQVVQIHKSPISRYSDAVDEGAVLFPFHWLGDEPPTVEALLGCPGLKLWFVYLNQSICLYGSEAPRKRDRELFEVQVIGHSDQLPKEAVEYPDAWTGNLGTQWRDIVWMSVRCFMSQNFDFIIKEEPVPGSSATAYDIQRFYKKSETAVVEWIREGDEGPELKS